VKFKGKRELLASAMRWSGAAFLFSRLPKKNVLLVLNYHRIGNRNEEPFDAGVFSATADEFNDQISYLKRRVSLVTLEEALAFIDGELNEAIVGEKIGGCRVLITFDDGYIDNYDIAYPILRSHGVQGVFFLATSMVGSSQVPWWDEIACLVKTARVRKFSLRYPAELVVDIEENGLTESLNAILKLYKMPGNADHARFMQELAQEGRGQEPPQTERRFLSWDEARQMMRGGMAIGSHTRSHMILSQLQPEQQLEELRESRAILQEKLGSNVDVLAYPVGSKGSFTHQTQSAAQQTGYRAAFSHYGGTNLRGRTSPFDVNRIAVHNQSQNLFRVQTSFCSATGRFWP
jgi:peptidoglycan/xylan/chitin deacetylase (PgdA/CDA1 family)